MNRDELRDQFSPLFAGTGGIDSWLGDDTPDEVFERLGALGSSPLSRVQLNQLLILSHEAGLTDGFFKYYWLAAPSGHPYDVTSIPKYDDRAPSASGVVSVDHLYWGLYRLYVDALLYFGNIRAAFRYLRELSFEGLEAFFGSRAFDTQAIEARGPSLDLVTIAKDDRYLISEMACKSLEAPIGGPADLRRALSEAYADHQTRGGGPVSMKELLDGDYVKRNYSDTQQMLIFTADDILAEIVDSPEDLEERYGRLAAQFTRARNAALKNTNYYLSMVGDLDVYVATSMRTRDDFRQMADFCATVFSDDRLGKLQLRYFDPTLSAAEGHEDKGLIECLMVKSSKVLLYSAGSRDSYGKDAEAAMALSLGKPVIFYCQEEERERFLRDVHPLSRLIDFQTGVPVGAMVTSNVTVVSDLLYRIFTNRMEYRLEQHKPGYLRLREALTNSVVRLQTSDTLLRETFWNYYHKVAPPVALR
jgi:hypothetical protein